MSDLRDRRLAAPHDVDLPPSSGVLLAAGPNAKSKRRCCNPCVILVFLVLWTVLAALVFTTIWDASLVAQCNLDQRVTYSYLKPRKAHTNVFEPCRFDARPGEPLDNRPRLPWDTHANGVLLEFADEIRDQLGFIIVLRRGSALEAYRGLRGDRDIDAHLFVPSGLSIGCAYRKIEHLMAKSAALQRAQQTLHLQVRLVHGWPLPLLYFDRFDTPLLRASERLVNVEHQQHATEVRPRRVDIDLEVLSEELLFDREFNARVKAQTGIVPKLCQCSLGSISTNAKPLCFDDPEMHRYLLGAYGQGFMVPAKIELPFDMVNHSWILRTRIGTWLWNTLSTAIGDYMTANG
jgi:hypothetical protein